MNSQSDYSLLIEPTGRVPGRDTGPRTESGCWISVRRLAIITVCLPLFALFFCVHYALRYHFKSSTATHCGVTNYLPSLSAATGLFTLSSFLWKLAIALHTPGRLLLGLLVDRLWRQRLDSNHIPVSVLTLRTLYLLEVFSLLGLSWVSSSQNFPVHKMCFATFLVSAHVHMLLTCLLLSRCSAGISGAASSVALCGRFQQRSLYWKRVCLCTSVVSAGVCVYVYGRHNAYCEPGMYTIFALTEYIVTVCNMCFHMTAYWDLYNVRLHLPSLYSASVGQNTLGALS